MMPSVYLDSIHTMLKQCTQPVTPETIASSLGLSKESVYPGLCQLVDAGHVIKFGNGWYQARKSFRTAGPTKKQVKAKRSPSHQKKTGHYGPSAVSKPDYINAQDELNKSMREAVDKLCEETEMTEEKPKYDVKKYTEDQDRMLESIDGLASKVSKPEIVIPSLNEVTFKLDMLNRFIELTEYDGLREEIQELIHWICEIDLIVRENTKF